MREEKKMGDDFGSDKTEGQASGPAKPSVSESDRRRARAAAKLKENLSRRKQQVRARRAGEADETDGLPAAKMDES
jgi:hypothetical protein